DTDTRDPSGGASRRARGTSIGSWDTSQQTHRHAWTEVQGRALPGANHRASPKRIDQQKSRFGALLGGVHLGGGKELMKVSKTSQRSKDRSRAAGPAAASGTAAAAPASPQEVDPSAPPVVIRGAKSQLTGIGIDWLRVVGPICQRARFESLLVELFGAAE